MLNFSVYLRPPAHKLTLTQRLQNTLSDLLSHLLPCRHRLVSWPFESRQRCIDCGAWRYFAFCDDGSISKGPWRPGGTGRDRSTLPEQRVGGSLAECERESNRRHQ